MPAGKEVRPLRWSNVIDLYDDGEFSAIWGEYQDEDGKKQPRLGIRWNKIGSVVGYPNLGDNPVWFVIPHKFTAMFLFDLYSKATGNNSFNGNLENILTALKERLH
ncbi:MAG: hypothetical protein LBH43_02005 [Treponema sp.]|jgi:hypothetical protein|nr:hypothetical protein [Treponema sp.]